MLTHLSQKYIRPEEFLPGARDIFPNTEVAQDLMEIDVKRRDQ